MRFGGRCLSGLILCRWVETSSYFAFCLEELMCCQDFVRTTFKKTHNLQFLDLCCIFLADGK